MRRSPAIILAAALAASACSASDAPAALSSPTAGTADPDSVVQEASAPQTSEQPRPAPNEDEAPPAGSIQDDSGASDGFSSDHLLVGAGARFVVLDDPQFVKPDQATWLSPDDVVLGVIRGGDAVAFPVMQMAYHHIANTTIAGEPYLVTY